ncbi:MAG: NUDIX domain-containing protein [Alphaproteobacteria bacterium]|nr:NUDIX domain-containing protein [Alphaproteobacteria bacterium]
MENTIKIGVGVYIFNNHNQLLLGLRKSPHAKGTWCPPGGHMEYGETNEQAAIRETKEETGLQLLPQDITLKGVTNDFYPESQKHYITLHLYCKHYKGTPIVTEPDKCVCWEWFDLDNLPSPLMLSNQNFFKQQGII